ncbi:hypothetical protein BDZ89DRAFT_1062430 [Hymenopellis radicata]|nr:hypothetical protein BDZ89DRAFT_1062430 [Hymenopellis radicata]
MAEILGTVTAIISLVELTSTAVRYLKAIKNAPKDCQDICRELHILETYAVDLKNLVKGPQARCDEDWARSFQELNRPGGPIQELFFQLKNLETRVKPKQKLKVFKHRVMWVALGKKESEALLKCVERVIGLLKAAIQLDHIKLDLEIKRDIEDVRTAVDKVQTGVESLDFRVEFQTALMLKSIEVGNSFSVIGQARDYDIDAIDNVRQWFYHTVCSYAREAKLEAIASGIISSPNFSNFSIPQGILSRGSDFQFKGWLKAVSLDDFGHSPQKTISILLQLDDVLRWHRYSLTAEGVSIPWKCLHDVSFRKAEVLPSSHFDLFQTLLADDGKKILSSIKDRWHFIDFQTRAKFEFVNWSGGFYLSFSPGEIIYIFGVHGTAWYGISESGYVGYVSPMHVDMVAGEDSERKLQEVRTHSPEDQWGGLNMHVLAKRDFHAEASDPKHPLLSYDSGDVVHILHSGQSATFGKFWYGCSEGNWGFVNPEDFDEIEEITVVSSTSGMFSDSETRDSEDEEGYFTAESDVGD